MAKLDDPGGRLPLNGFVDGVPHWLGESLRHCSRCGAAMNHGRVDGEDRERHHCVACGFIAYVNPRMVVSTLPVTDAGELVLIRRGIPPGHGSWAQPGGFLESDETAVQGAIRETREETGLIVEPNRIVGLYSRPQAAVVVVAYEAHISGGEMTPTPEALEVQPFAIGDIPWAGIAFNTTLWALRDWVAAQRPGADIDALGSEREDE